MMPKGKHGIRQLEILDMLQQDDNLLLTEPGDSPSLSWAYRRAAHRLADEGLVVLARRTVEGRSHLVASRPRKA